MEEAFVQLKCRTYKLREESQKGTPIRVRGLSGQLGSEVKPGQDNAQKDFR